MQMRIFILGCQLLGLVTDVSHGAGAVAADGTFSPHDAANATPETVARVKALKPGETLRFAPGVWHFRREGAERMLLTPSNNQSGEKNVVFPLAGKRDVTIDGGGAAFRSTTCRSSGTSRGR